MTYMVPPPPPEQPTTPAPEPVNHGGSKDNKVGLAFRVSKTEGYVVGPVSDRDESYRMGRARPTPDGPYPFKREQLSALIVLRGKVMDRIALENECLPKDRRISRGKHTRLPQGGTDVS